MNIGKKTRWFLIVGALVVFGLIGNSAVSNSKKESGQSTKIEAVDQPKKADDTPSKTTPESAIDITAKGLSPLKALMLILSRCLKYSSKKV